MLVLDKYGFPVEKIKGHPVVNFIRMVIHGRKIWGSIRDWNDLDWLRSKCENCGKRKMDRNFACEVDDSEEATISCGVGCGGNQKAKKETD